MKRVTRLLAILFTALGAVSWPQAEGVAAKGSVRSPQHVVPTNLPGVYAFTQPPDEFDPMSASPQELEAWGFPPRPSASEGVHALNRWREEINLTSRARRVVPELVKREGVHHQAVKNLHINSPSSTNAKSINATSSNWSGYALTPATSAQPFYLVSGRWIVPTVKQAPGTCSGGWDYSSHWVGIGGFNDAYLLQAGSAANVFCDVGNDIAEYFPWLEWLPASELVIYKNASTMTLYPFAPGDYVTVTVWATNFTSGSSTTGNLSYADVTQGWSISLTFTASSVGGSQATGMSAEWIVERTDVGGSFATLPDYVADPWWYTRAVDLGAGTHYPGSTGGSTVYNVTMLDDSNATVSIVDLFGTDSLWFFPEGSAIK